MTDEQILKLAIEKAEDNGWSFDGKMFSIFSHDFAKAFWGEEKIREDDGMFSREVWQHYLQEMVLEKEPLKYLEKFIGENYKKQEE